MDAILKHVVTNALMGSALGVIFGLVLLATNTLSIRSLVGASTDVAGATAIFLLGCAMTFTPLVISTAVGLLSDSP